MPVQSCRNAGDSIPATSVNSRVIANTHTHRVTTDSRRKLEKRKINGKYLKYCSCLGEYRLQLASQPLPIFSVDKIPELHTKKKIFFVVQN